MAGAPPVTIAPPTSAQRGEVGKAGRMLDEARRWVQDASRVTVLTGAGISTDSGIPDFRGPNGVWTKNPAAEKASTLQHYLADPEVRRAAWQNRLHSPAWDARPNAGHRAFVELEHQGKLVAVVTQNIDELHQRAGNDPAKVIEVHGTMRSARCWECGDRRSMDELLDRVRAGEDDPACAVCGRDRQERHDLVRAVAGARGDRGRRRGGAVVRRADRRRVDAERVPGGQPRAAGQGRWGRG